MTGIKASRYPADVFPIAQEFTEGLPPRGATDTPLTELEARLKKVGALTPTTYVPLAATATSSHGA